MNWRAWTPVLPLLALGRDVLAPTLPGHLGGPKPPPGAGLTLTSLADWAEAELDRAGLASPDLAGNSLGALVALELARRGRARRVVAISPAGMYSGAQMQCYMTALPSARLVELPGLGHCAQLDDPDRVAAEIFEFLAL